MHTHYYVHRSHGTQTSNKLQKEISEFLCSLDGNLIDAVDLEKFQKIILETIEKLNLKHPRCKPFKVSFERVSQDRSIRLSGYYYEHFYLYKATLTHLSTVEYKSLSNN
jgi:hypothetical protein